MQIIQTLRRTQGIARTHELLSAGNSRREIENACNIGIIARLRKGVYALEAADSVAVAATHGGAATCITALRQYGVWILSDSTDVHVRIGRNERAHSHRGCSCRAHYAESDTSFGVVTCADALISSARCLTTEAFFAAFESAWRLRLISTADCKRIRASLPTGLAHLLGYARSNADSGLESIFRYRLMMLGIQLASQVPISGVGRVDFVFKKVIFEIDGEENHDGKSNRHRDLMRDARAAQRGYITYRFDYAMIIHDWHTVLATIHRALGISVFR